MKLASAKLCVLKKLDSGQSTKQEVLYINFSHAVFCLLFMLGNAGLGLALHGDLAYLSTRFKVKMLSCVCINTVKNGLYENSPLSVNRQYESTIVVMTLSEQP